MRYQYAGPGPVIPEGAAISGEILRPGDVREFDQAPDGPWELLDPPTEPEAEPEPEAAPVTPFTPPATPEGM